MSSVFWKFSLVPDAFALHWALQISTLFAFLNPRIKNETHRFHWMNLLMGLGMSNHLTTVLLAPLWLYQAWKVKKPRSICLSTSIGFLIPALFYMSILLFDRKHYLSWGFIENLHGILRHFLRSDYGTLSLSASHQQSFFVEYLKLFAKHFYSEFLPLILLMVTLTWASFVRKKRLIPLQFNAKHLAILCSLLLYLGPFFSLFNVGPFGFGFDVFEKFMGMPLILLLTLIIVSFNDEQIYETFFQSFKISSPVTHFIWLSLLLISATNNGLANADRMDYRNRVILEEIAKNLVLQEAPDSRKKTFVTAMSDTSLFSLYYVLGVLRANPNVYAVSPVGFETLWNRKSLQHNFPNLKFEPTKSGRYFIEDFIRDNDQHYNFLVEQNVNNSDFALEFHRVGRFVNRGQGITFKDAPQSRLLRSATWSEIPVSNYLIYDPDLEAYSRYSHYYLARGMSAYNAGKLQAAIIDFDNALLEVPYCQPCLANKCKILAELKEYHGANSCIILLNRISSEYLNYYGLGN